MLHKQTVATETLAILRFVQTNPLFNQTRLVGGTALSLQYGHRLSLDLDFFGKIDLSVDEITKELQHFGSIQTLKNSKSILILSVNNVKIDFVNYSYLWLEDTLELEGFKLALAVDIAAMKIATITGRGSKKDFFDLDLLLNYYSLENIFNFFEKKYTDASVYLALKSLVYFEDADNEPDPIILNGRTWRQVKRNVEAIQVKYLEKLGA